VGGGAFAQRAVLRGDREAASRLGAAVYEFLAAQRAQRRVGKRSAQTEMCDAAGSSDPA
jgi:hypothetical protein